MLLRVLTAILIILVIAESAYIVLGRHTINRFKPVDQDGYVAFDSATGQLCRSYRSKAPAKTFKPAPPTSLPPQSKLRPEDRILAAIEAGAPTPKQKTKPKLSSFAGFLLAQTFVRSTRMPVEINGDVRAPNLEREWFFAEYKLSIGGAT